MHDFNTHRDSMVILRQEGWYAWKGIQYAAKWKEISAFVYDTMVTAALVVRLPDCQTTRPGHVDSYAAITISNRLRNQMRRRKRTARRWKMMATLCARKVRTKRPLKNNNFLTRQKISILRLLSGSIFNSDRIFWYLIGLFLISEETEEWFTEF